MQLFVYSPVASAVHDMHLDAIASYATEAGLTAHTAMGRPRLRDLWGTKNRRVIIEATGLWNALAVPILRLRSAEVLYYLHEPSTLRTKLSRGNGLIKSLAWQGVQRLDVMLSNTVIVSREELRTRATSVYGTKTAKLKLAPLLIPPPLDEVSTDTIPRITYLGRIDERRYLQEFLLLADHFRAEGFQPTILSSDRQAVLDLQVPDCVDVIAEPNFSEETKASVLNETALVWNPKSYDISQSGVTVDALRYGCQIVLTDGDPECADLEANGIAIRFDGSSVVDLDSVERTAAMARQTQSLFTERHGSNAFNAHYLPLLDRDRAAA